MDQHDGLRDRIVAAHDDVGRLVDATAQEKGPDLTDPRNGSRVFDTAVAAISAHVSAMMTVLYPAMRRSLPDSHGDLRKLERDAREMASVMRGMEQHLNGDTNRPSESISELRADLEALFETHKRTEEALLARLESVWSADERKEWTTKFENAMRHAPTRPHPHLPRSHALLTPAVGLSARWDHILDTLDARAVAGRPVRQPGPPGLWGWYLLGRPTAVATKQGRTKQG
jgi:Hemerythrin HHE cation binding domain